MSIAIYKNLLPLVAFALFCVAPANAAPSDDPCAAARSASPLAFSRGRLVISPEIAAFTARHAEVACAKLEALVRNTTKGDKKTAAAARTVQGEIETGLLEPIFRLYPDLAARDLTADAPGEQVKLGPSDSVPEPRQMGYATAQHLRWVVDDADRRALAVVQALATKDIKLADAAADVTSEISFIGAAAYRNYPQLWEIESRELEKRIPKQPRTARSDAAFRAAAPAPGSVKLTPAAEAQMRAFLTALKGHGCQILDLSWSLKTRWKGPDDTEWHESGPALGLGSRDCGQMPPDVVRTIDGMKVVFGSDKADRFAGKTIDFVDKKFLLLNH